MLRSLQEGFPSQVFKAKPDQIPKHKREIFLPVLRAAVCTITLPGNILFQTLQKTA